jgi:hypothetical protein
MIENCGAPPTGMPALERIVLSRPLADRHWATRVHVAERRWRTEEKSMSIRKTIAMSSGLILTLLTGGAAAVDEKTMPGTACQGYNTTDVRPFPRFVENWEGSETVAISTYCPMVRENEAGVLDRVTAYVYNFDSNRLNCYVDSYRFDSANGYVTTRTQASTQALGNQTISWDLTNSTDYSGGFYSLQCNLSGRDRIYGYRWREN